MKRATQVSVVILLSVLLTALACASESETFPLAADEKVSWTFNLDVGDTVTGSISIQGGTKNDLAVWVTDPVGAIVLNLGVVKQQCNMEFTANQSGAYRLHLENGGNALADGEKTVSVSYDIVSASRFLLPMMVIVAGVSAVIGGYYVWRKKTVRARRAL